MPSRAEYSRQYYLENKEKIQKQTKEYRQKNTEAIRARDRKRRTGDVAHLARCKAYNSQPEIKAKRREQSLSKLGWSINLYDYKFKEQEGVCAVCRRPNASGRFGVLTADHKHIEPPKPRGLLCGSCNKGIGFFLDNPSLLREAALYVEKYNE